MNVKSPAIGTNERLSPETFVMLTTVKSLFFETLKSDNCEKLFKKKNQQQKPTEINETSANISPTGITKT